ncbi:hypothetical protein M422DRAFT_68537 [Sphaerobolus stellatus SS14]|uniref:Uncharacterized protein n=1 Tax=Sphaerobolus stellatus (strain SS14) TaxID=990650 RepID=A0A0C9VQB9_SPHS4|nr:hypothetical protein M422DRAFT_68537 [Sphaerobolus stellatus SS14]
MANNNILRCPEIILIDNEDDNIESASSSTSVPSTSSPHFPATFPSISSKHGPQSIRLPRRLVRPEFRDVNRAALAAINPVLANIPVDYIRHTMRDIGFRMHEAAMSSKVVQPPSAGEVPSTMTVISPDPTVEPPSHMLAVYSDKNDSSNVSLFPAHALIVAIGCANVPPLPSNQPPPSSDVDMNADSYPQGDANMDTDAPEQVMAEDDPERLIVTIPVVPLCIPSVEMFQPLLTYLYTRRSDDLMDMIFPKARDDEEQSTSKRARLRPPPPSLLDLLNDARKVHALWSNACVLGAFDEVLFMAVEMAWEVWIEKIEDAIGAAGEEPSSNHQEGRYLF